MPLSLNRAARRNHAGTIAAAQAAVAADPTGALDAFRDLARDAKLSTNVTADKIGVFDAAGALLDARAVAQWRAGGDRAAGLRAFRLAQGAWYVRRVRFEALWTDGRKLVYGALNAGGVGADRFGKFSVVIAEPGGERTSSLALFPSNSAERYCSPDGVVDRDRARDEAVAWTDRADLAAVERADEAIAAPPADWPAVLCNPDRFIEVVTAPAPMIAAVESVRLRATYLERLQKLEARALAGDQLPGSERHELEAFETLHRWRRVHGVDVEGVG